MAYNQCKLVSDVRMYLGGISEDKLPESVIIYWGDFFDANPDYTDKYPYILWKTTLCSLEYLKANTVITASTSSTRSTSKEKVGDVEINISDSYASTEEMMNAYDDLYKDYLDHPEKFGIVLSGTGNVVHIGGVYQEEVDNNRCNPNTTSIYNALPVTAFPKLSDTPYRRRPDDLYRKR